MKGAVDAFLKWKAEAKGAVASTIANYSHRLRALLALPENDTRPIRWLVQRGADLYAASLTKKAGTVTRANDTHINGLAVGRMFGAYCVKQKMLKSNPFADVEPVGKRNRGSNKPRLTVNESRQLEAHCLADPTDPDRVLTYAYMMLGKRASELARVTVRDLDDDGWLLRITKAKTDTSVGSVPVPERLREMLLGLARARVKTAEPVAIAAEILVPTERSTAVFLFTQRDGTEPMSRFTARDRVRAVLKAAGVPVLPPQALRRTFTDNAGRQGIALTTIAEMAGHTSVAVTRRSYIGSDVVEAAAVERHLKVMQGGKK